MLPFQNKQEPLVSAWLILLSVAAENEVVAFRAMFLRNLTPIPPSLREIEGKKIINSRSLHSQEADGHNAVKEILTSVSVAILEKKKKELKQIFKIQITFFSVNAINLHVFLKIWCEVEKM